jgi:hypothetical protein
MHLSSNTQNMDIDFIHYDEGGIFIEFYAFRLLP